MIVPQFSTLTPESEFAFKSAFLDAVSPYYTYGTYWCGFSKIKIYGTIADYQLMINTLNKISAKIILLKPYFDQCINQLNDVINHWDDSEYWSNICKTIYGYVQHDVDGWFTKFFYNVVSNDIKAYPSHITSIEYKDMETDEKYIMYVGILSSVVEDKYMIPQFNKIVTKK